MNISKDLRYDVFRILKSFSLLATVLATLSSIINARPVHVILQPFIASLFIIGMWIYETQNPKNKYFSKIVFMTFFNLIYIPVAWIYSPGISSAIGYYAILTIVLSVFFVEKLIEFILPVFSLVFSVFMIRYELYNPQKFDMFPDRITHFNDVTANFMVVTLLLFMVVAYINRHYVIEKERFYNLSITDELTGVYNRRYLLSALEDLTSELKGRSEFHLIFIDINNFKEINDTYGHHTGDDVLIELGSLLHKQFEICGRFGGDEFLAIVLNKNVEEVKNLINPIKKAFHDYAIEHNFKNLSISSGITSSGSKSAEEIIREADQYMYEAKFQDKSVKEVKGEN